MTFEIPAIERLVDSWHGIDPVLSVMCFDRAHFNGVLIGLDKSEAWPATHGLYGVAPEDRGMFATSGPVGKWSTLDSCPDEHNECSLCRLPYIAMGSATCSCGAQANIDRHLLLSFERTFELHQPNYYTVLVPAVSMPGGPLAVTRWHHETDTLTRGCFKTPRDAEAWAREHLEGHPFSVKFCEL